MGGEIDRRTDVFALGTTLWELACDRRLFKRDEDVDTLFAVLSTDVFLLLTEARGWSVPAYRAWAARTVRTILNLEGAP